MESDHEIAAPDFAMRHPELYHYTDFAGFQGITSTNTIWATHFAHLNDLAEMRALREPMADQLLVRIKHSLRKEFFNRNEWRSFEAKFKIDREVSIFVDAVFDAAFTAGNPEPLAESYITSVCTHPDTSYEAKNGLLSQWRAYGSASQRYCIVFDTRELIAAIENEWERFHWVYLRLTEARYDSDGLNIEKLFPEMLDLYENYLVDAIKNGLDLVNREMIGEFIAAAIKFKHRAFREENEARIVAIPYKQSMVDELRSMDPTGDKRDVKIVNIKKTTKGEIPYLTLFDARDAKLPVKRVIVGPSRNQAENFERARSVLGRRSSLHLSKTPFVG